MRRLHYSIAFTALAGSPAFAADLQIGIDIPSLNVAEYHRPYVAVWIEGADQTVASNLALWYQSKANNGGAKWLKDLRQWWRRSGRELTTPIDGVSSATRPVGTHKLSFTEGTAPFAKLPAGDYKLVVEAAREGGGREVLSLPFQWPAQKPLQLQAKGDGELGAVTLDIRP